MFVWIGISIIEVHVPNYLLACQAYLPFLSINIIDVSNGFPARYRPSIKPQAEQRYPLVYPSLQRKSASHQVQSAALSPERRDAAML